MQTWSIIVPAATEICKSISYRLVHYSIRLDFLEVDSSQRQFRLWSLQERKPTKHRSLLRTTELEGGFSEAATSTYESYVRHRITSAM